MRVSVVGPSGSAQTPPAARQAQATELQVVLRGRLSPRGDPSPSPSDFRVRPQKHKMLPASKWIPVVRASIAGGKKKKVHGPYFLLQCIREGDFLGAS